MERTLIIPFSKKLIGKLHNFDVIVETNDISVTNEIADTVNSKNKLSGIKISLPFMSMSEIAYKEEWNNIPLMLYCNNIGDVFFFMSKLDLIRSLDIIFFLPSSVAENYYGLKILSSLGLRSGLYFNNGTIDENRFIDLSSFNYLSLIPHIPIEPFSYILDHLYKDKQINIGNVYMDNPIKYVYIDEDENIALTKKDLIDGKYIQKSIEAIKDVSWDEFIEYKMNTYYSHFFNIDKCTVCPSMKICGSFFMNRFKNCSNVMGEIYEEVDLRQKKNSQLNNI